MVGVTSNKSLPLNASRQGICDERVLADATSETQRIAPETRVKENIGVVYARARAGSVKELADSFLDNERASAR